MYVAACIGMVYVQYHIDHAHEGCIRDSLPPRPSPLVNGLGGGGGRNTENWEKLA